jgi:hypothetical protein
MGNGSPAATLLEISTVFSFPSLPSSHITKNSIHTRANNIINTPGTCTGLATTGAVPRTP